MKLLAKLVLERLGESRVDYADARVIHRLQQEYAVVNDSAESVCFSESYGIGIRVLRNGCWGFASCSDFTTERINKAIESAVLIAEAAQVLPNSCEPFQPPARAQASYSTPVKRDPFAVSPSAKVDLLLRCTAAMQAEKQVRQARATMICLRERKIFFSTLGSWIEQEIVECGAGLIAQAFRDGELQVRSYPKGMRGGLAAAGYEFIEGLGLEENAPRVASEAAQLLSAPVCPTGLTDVILEGSQLALQLHESIGHAVELDRILGHEASRAGTSFIQPELIGKLRYGSEVVNVVCDATVPQAVGSFAYDDEGTPASRDEILREGVLVGALSSCSTAPRIGRASNGAMRADGWMHFPLIRMTNINLEPGEWDFDALLDDTKSGLLLETNRSWSIDDKRINFQFATETAREIHQGKLGRLLKNPLYTGVSTHFWNSCDAVCNRRAWKMWGVANCSKGEPAQSIHVGHGCAPARFRKVMVRGRS